MKWLIFLAASAVIVPLTAALCTMGARYRSWLLAALALTPFFGDLVNINLLSMEQYRGPDRGFEISLTDLVALGLATGLLAKPSRLGLWPPGTLPGLLLFGLATVGTLFAEVPLFGAFTLWKCLRLYLLFWVVFQLVRQGVALELLYRSWAFMGLFSALLVAKQKYADGIYRILLFFDHSNTVPLFLNLVMPMLLLWALAGPSTRVFDAWLGVLGALAMVGSVAMTYSRAGLALSAVAVAGVLMTALVRRPGLRSISGALAILVVGLIGLSLAADSLIARFLNAPKASGEARKEFNLAAEAMALDHPIGVGLNQYSEILTHDSRYRGFVSVTANEKEAGVVHHIYWLTAAELGFPGLVLFLGFLGQFGFLALRSGIAGSGLDGLTSLGAAVGFFAVHTQGLLEWALRISPVSYQFALVCGLVAGVAHRIRTQRRPAVEKTARPAALREGSCR
ncbi:MAG: O-antigen ligase family protein [Holophagales bacterium]|nr:O-antigen ligase family protein [Holophagales bacterium]